MPIFWGSRNVILLPNFACVSHISIERLGVMVRETIDDDVANPAAQFLCRATAIIREIASRDTCRILHSLI
jgi:hypothetical protein